MDLLFTTAGQAAINTAIGSSTKISAEHLRIRVAFTDHYTPTVGQTGLVGITLAEVPVRRYRASRTQLTFLAPLDHTYQGLSRFHFNEIGLFVAADAPAYAGTMIGIKVLQQNTYLSYYSQQASEHFGLGSRVLFKPKIPLLQSAVLKKSKDIFNLDALAPSDSQWSNKLAYQVTAQTTNSFDIVGYWKEVLSLGTAVEIVNSPTATGGDVRKVLSALYSADTNTTTVTVSSGTNLVGTKYIRIATIHPGNKGAFPAAPIFLYKNTISFPSLIPQGFTALSMHHFGGGLVTQEPGTYWKIL